MSLKRSKYGRFFDQDATRENAICSECKISVKFTSQNGPNSLKNHVQRHHPLLFKDLLETEAAKKEKKKNEEKIKRQRATIPFPVVETKKFKVETSAEKNTDRAVVEFICTDLQPFSIVEQIGFRKMMKNLAPNVTLKSRHYYGSVALNSLHADLMKRVRTLLENCSEVALTTDAWSSADSKHHLLSVTAHFIDNETFSPGWCVLAAKSIKVRGTAPNYKQLMEEVLSSYEIPPSRVTAITRDGGTNVKNMCDLMSVPSIHCFSHVLQLVLGDTVYKNQKYTKSIDNFKRIARKIRKSSVLRNQYNEILDESELPGTMLAQECKTRWSSLHFMLKSFIRNKRSVEILTIDNPDLTLTESDWKNAKILMYVLAPISENTTAAQHRFLSPCSVIIPALKLLKFKFQEILEDHSIGDDEKAITTEVLEVLETRGRNYLSMKTLRFATFLDVRFKNIFLDDDIQREVEEELLAMFPEQEDDEKPDDEGLEIAEKCSIYDKFISYRVRMTPPPSLKKMSIGSEIQQYCATSPSSTADPFKFWRENQNFPRLKSMAQKLLAVAATSAESERLFSIAGQICVPKRNRIGEGALEKYIFCNANIAALDI
uniref:Dimer_Tnp_hAT domain-containing protein n=2 Tax=Caenorhabditis japonica TaxID=281687 RepID=A0A8R1IGR5_CAEJA